MTHPNLPDPNPHARESADELAFAHLREATDRTSELLAMIGAERSTVSREMLIDAVRTHATAILQELWEARWALAIDSDPQAMTVADWPEAKDETE